MIITFEKNTGREKREELARAAAKLLPGASFSSRGDTLTVMAASPEKLADALPALDNLPGIKGIRVSDPELCPRACSKKRKTPSSPLDFRRAPLFIAGPCAVEDEKSYLAAATALKAAGADALRAAIFKPRSSPYSFQGIGWPGLKIIRKAGNITGLPLVTEVTDTRQVERVSAVCEVLQIGTRNMRNYELLKEAAASGRAILLKRGLRAPLREWLLSAEYLLKHGANKLILCERGDAIPGGNRPLLDLKLMAEAKKITGLPVIADPSHAARDRRVAALLAVKALRAGADGLLMEASPDPLAARIDGRQTVTIETFRAIAEAACRSRR